VRAPIPPPVTDFSIYMGLIHALLPFMVLNIFVSLRHRPEHGRRGPDARRFTLARVSRRARCPLCCRPRRRVPGLLRLSSGTYIRRVARGPGLRVASLIYDVTVGQFDWPLARCCRSWLLFLGAVAAYNHYMGPPVLRSPRGEASPDRLGRDPPR
jgi:spermidine/putrescine transport system permease protein